MENGPCTPDGSIVIEDSDDGEDQSTPVQKEAQSKDLVWLNPECKVPRSQITDEMIATLIVTCTACGHQINHHKCKIYLHRHLNVIVCKRCYRYYGDGSFQKDSTGADEYCTWCAEGGNLLICDRCSRAFCKNCIRRNLTRRELSRVMALDTWHCYVCVPDQVAEIVRFAQTIQEYATKDRSHLRRPASPEMEEDRMKETVSGIAEQLRQMASFLESGIQSSPASILKRASSLLRSHVKTVSKMAEKVEYARKKRTKSKTDDHTRQKDHRKSTELGQGDVPNRVRKASVEEVEDQSGNQAREFSLDVGQLNLLEVQEKDENTGKKLGKAKVGKKENVEAKLGKEENLKKDENPQKKHGEGENEGRDESLGKKLRKEESHKKEASNVPPVKEATETGISIQEVKTSDDEGAAEVVEVDMRVEEPDTDADEIEKGGAASAEHLGPEGDPSEATVDVAEADVISVESTLVLNLGDRSDAVEVDSDNKMDKQQQEESKNESPSLLDELCANVEDTAKEVEAPDAETVVISTENDATLAKEEETVAEKLLQQDVDNSTMKEAEEKTEEVKEVRKKEDSSSSDGGNASASRAETESSESETPKTPKRPPKTRSPRKRTPLTENEKARRALQRSLRAARSESSSSSEEDELRDSKTKLSPRICKTTPLKRGRRLTLTESSLLKSSDGEELLKGLAPDDPKLRSKPVVMVNKLALDLDEVMQDNDVKEKASTKGSDSDDDEIAALLTMPRILRRRKSKVQEAKEQPGKKRARKSKPESSKEGSESDKSNAAVSDDELPCGQKLPEENDKSPLKSKNELSKEALLKSIIESSESSDESEEEILPTKKRRSKKQTTEDEKEDEEAKEEGEDVVLESEEEVVGTKKSKKMQKYEKLLYRSTTIHSDEATEQEKEEGTKDKDAEKTKSRKKGKLTFTDEDTSADKQEAEDSSSEESSSSSSSDSSSDVKSKKKKKGAKNTKAGRAKKRKDTSSSTESEKPKKKRRRIKVAASTDQEEDSDGDEEVVTPSQNTDGKGRKNIRKVLTDSELHKRTKLAAQAEEERKKRIRERQKLYNEAMGSAAQKEDITVDRLVLEMNTETKEVIVEVEPCLVKCMKPHQTKGVKFMYDCTIETVELLAKDKKGSGAILAHCMGLGKTFQVVSFLHTVLTNEHTKKHLKTALVVCPYNTVLNWVREFEQWLEEKDLDLTVHEISAIRDNYTRVDILNLWQNEGGVLIMGYDKFRLLVNAKGRRFSSKLRDSIEKALLDPGPDLVICDEGHVLKNDASGLSKAMSRLRTNRRIVLTGTPLQNNLNEYHCMVNFVKPNLLGTKKEFLNRFVNPIRNGQCADSTVLDVKLMKKRVHILHSLLDGCVQRCDYSALAPFLPPKYEYVISVRLSEQQVALYRYFLDNLARNRSQRIAIGVLADYHILRNVWTHPYLLEVSAARAAAKEAMESEDDFINDDSTTDEGSDKDEVICLSDGQPSTSKKGSRKKGGNSSDEEVVKSWQTRSRGTVDDEVEVLDPEPEQREKSKSWWSHIVPEEDMEKMEISGKIILLCKILQECDAIGDKVLLFSQSLNTLDMIEKMLHQFEERATAAEADPMALININDPLRDCQNTWSVGVDYFRMDGSTSVDLRKRWIELFNSEDHPRARLFLISTKAGSLGTNLVGANRVILMDASWNPTHDVQAIFRVYRFGQKKPVYIYRLLAQGTMEEKIYDRQVTKQSLSCRVIDEQQIERHFNAADLQELYCFNPDSKSNRPTPMVPKDRLLAELLLRHKEWIVSYHEHDSLLQNVTEEDLTEEERKAAWEEYNAEREGRLQSNMQEASAGFTQQQPTPNTSGTGRQFTLDLNKIIGEIRRRNPNITQAQLAINLKNALLLFRSQFRKQQMDAFTQRAQYLKYKQPVPQEITDRLGESSMAIQQLNTVLSQLDRSINMQNASRINAQQFARGPNIIRQQQQFRYASQQHVRMQQQNAWGNQYKQQPHRMFRPFQSYGAASAPIISEVEDITPPPGPAQKPSTSSVTITEIID